MSDLGCPRCDGLMISGSIASKFHGDYIDNMDNQFLEQLKKRGNVILYPNIQGFEDKLKNFVNKYPDLKPWYEKIIAVK